MSQENELSMLIVLESSRCLVARQLDSDTAVTLLALVSDDPSSWDEAMSVWPRYRTPAVCEFASSLPFEETDRETALAGLRTAEAWAVIDFDTKRIFTGGQFQSMERDAAYAMVVDEGGRQHCPLSIHLPPWWELHAGVVAGSVDQPRQSPIRRPHVNRDVLYGDVFLAAMAARILEAVAHDDRRSDHAGDHPPDHYSLTLAVHRDWLMTPRDDLNGRTPRELLHGANTWSDHVTWGQRLRFDDGEPLVAVPDNWDGFPTAPMGSQEMCIYFDLCRQLISAGWSWCDSDEGQRAIRQNESALSRLTRFLGDVKEDWLSSPFEGGSPPSVIIECDRRRVPVGAGVTIEGFGEIQSEQHVADCDCPICEMMADGMFGVGFSGIDGHHLELDNEFAFSMHETRDAWEEEQRAFAGFSAAMDRKEAEREASGTEDLLASAWSGVSDERPIPGDRGGYIRMAFMVAEIVSALQDLDADHGDIRALNEAFADFRRSDDGQCAESACRFREILQTLGNHYPDLVSKSADLQSRIDEAVRVAANTDSDLDFPS